MVCFDKPLRPISFLLTVFCGLCTLNEHISYSQSARQAGVRDADDVAIRTHIFNASSGYAPSSQQQTVNLQPIATLLSDEPDRPMTGGDTFTHSPGCTQCGNASERTAKRSYRVESIKREILRKLHLRAAPNVTGRQLPALPHIQRLVEQLSGGHQNDAPASSSPPSMEPFDADDVAYNNNQTGGMYGNWEDIADEDRATTMKVIQISKPVPVERHLTGSWYDASRFCYFPFPMSEIRSPSQIVDVIIGIYIRPAPVQQYQSSSGERHTYILIYMIRPNGERNLLRKRRIALTSTDTGKWCHFSLKKEEIQHWITTPETNYGLMVQGSDGRGQPIAIVTPRDTSEESLRPYIQVQMSEPSSSRPKRTTDMNCDELSPETRCCRYPLTVDFEAFQWDWVIVPKRYSAFYCSGECPYHFLQHLSHTQVSQMARPAGAGAPCCTPRKWSSISMLYYDEHWNIVYGLLRGMVVDRCGCS